MNGAKMVKAKSNGDCISRQAALDIIDAELNGWLTDDERLHLEGVGTGIECLPSIDAVPVVRCKDCRWKEQEQPGMVYCPAIVGGWVDEDWFCKGGETDA